jgi:multisubunit Na+/H+ antiporter MnhB subunit
MHPIMKVSHTAIGWSLVTASLLLIAFLCNALRVRNIAAKRFVIDALLVLLCGAAGAAIATVLLLKFHRWGWEGLILVPLLVTSAITPFFLGSLYGGERLNRQPFDLKNAVVSFLASTTITLLLAIVFFKLINGPDGGSTGGWEFGYVALFVLCPLLWIYLFVSLYLIKISATTHKTSSTH